MSCEYCELAQKNPENLVYEDNCLVVAVKDKALATGQVTVFPKEHFTILELVPEDILQKCFLMANKLSMAAFESLGCQGTNILVQNGVSAGQTAPHFGIEIIPRRENDALNLQWSPKQLMEDEMETAFLILKEEGEKLVNIGKTPVKKDKTESENREDPKKEVIRGSKENYLLKSLKRVP